MSYKLEVKGKALTKESESFVSILRLARDVYSGRGKKEEGRSFPDGKRKRKKKDANEVKREFQQIFQ